MTEVESTMACALVATRETAERTVAALGQHGIPAAIVPPCPRHHGLPPGMWEIRVPASQAARARALLSAAGS